MNQTNKITKPRIAKMVSIIRHAGKAQTLVGGSFTSRKGAEGCKSAGRCAMAELFFQIPGYSVLRLKKMGATESEWTQKEYQDLWSAYRIDSEDATAIIHSNDDVGGNCSLEDFETRTEEVIRTIKNLQPRERTNPFVTRLENGEPRGPLATPEDLKVLKRLNLLDAYNDQDEYSY